MSCEGTFFFYFLLLDGRVALARVQGITTKSMHKVVDYNTQYDAPRLGDGDGDGDGDAGARAANIGDRAGGLGRGARDVFVKRLHVV